METERSQVSWFFYVSALGLGFLLYLMFLMSIAGTDKYPDEATPASYHCLETYGPQGVGSFCEPQDWKGEGPLNGVIAGLASISLALGLAIIAALTKVPDQVRDKMKHGAEPYFYVIVATLILGVPAVYLTGIFGGSWTAFNLALNTVFYLGLFWWLGRKAFFDWR